MPRAEEEVRSTAALLTELQRLRSDPVLRPYVGGSALRPPTLRAAEGTPSRREEGAESLVAFQTRLSREEETRLRNSLEAQRAFQQALQSLAACRAIPGAAAEGRTRTDPPPPPAAPAAGPAGLSFAPRSESAVGERAAERLQDAAATMQEKLALRDRTIQRLQTELDETRAMYEAEIARMRAAHAQWRHEAEREAAELKTQLTQWDLVGHSTVSATADSAEFLEALEFKERLLQEMQDAFQRASEEWKSDTARTVAELRLTAEQEVRGVVNKAKGLVEELQTALSALATCRPCPTAPLTADVAERLLQEEATLLSSWEEKLREHVRTAVRRAVRGRVKELLRPLVERELPRLRELGAPRQPSPAHAALTAGPARGASPPPVLISSPSPDAVRYGEAPALLRQERRAPPQRREFSAESATAATVLGAVAQHVTAEEQLGPHAGTGRPSWLKRFCY
ncbi:uncharacterized protein Tco025E_03406 [Trypanosoma conorhini]|uniref:Uncharacterized protein n=1 Tax=Trypanosoma conorhini TaxID=83891 RepID=A0A3S5ITM2_9TRYP|nr:uncharacterized protein Tco025E_03406 [Trypanosoma conorhini]RNF22138.1 hypothetical protein Tco025E_03406 [Trypanosoma conorhini]